MVRLGSCRRHTAAAGRPAARSRRPFRTCAIGCAGLAAHVNQYPGAGWNTGEVRGARKGLGPRTPQHGTAARCRLRSQTQREHRERVSLRPVHCVLGLWTSRTRDYCERVLRTAAYPKPKAAETTSVMPVITKARGGCRKARAALPFHVRLDATAPAAAPNATLCWHVQVVAENGSAGAAPDSDLLRGVRRRYRRCKQHAAGLQTTRRRPPHASRPPPALPHRSDAQGPAPGPGCRGGEERLPWALASCPPWAARAAEQQQ